MCHPSVIRCRKVMRHDEGTTLKLQDHHEGLRALPLNRVECGKGGSARVFTGLDGSARGRASALWRAGLCACPESGVAAGGARDRGRAPRGDGALAAGPSDAGTPGRLRAARLTAWGVPERRTDLMDVHMQRAEAVRQACIAAALQ